MKANQRNLRKRESGGATGIRTLETVSRLHTFQACAFDHSATAPCAPFSRKRDRYARPSEWIFCCIVNLPKTAI